MSEEPILSETERLRIEAEERLRYETRKQLQRKSHRLIWEGLGTLAALLVIIWMIGSIMLQHRFAVGSEVVLSNTAFTFGTQDALDQFEELPSDQATPLFQTAMKIPSGTRVRIVKSDANPRCITPVEEGQENREGWVELSWLERFSK